MDKTADEAFTTFCRRLSDLREAAKPQLWDVRTITRNALSLVARLMQEHPVYDPGEDVRFRWLLAVLEGARQGVRRPLADSGTEARMEFFLADASRIGGGL